MNVVVARRTARCLASALVAAVLLAGGSCAQDLALRVIADVGEVDFGAPFGVTVERTWPVGDTAEDWRDEDLAPLVLKLVAIERRETGTGFVETRQFEARAFQAGDVEVVAPVMRVSPAGGGTMRVAIGDEVLLRVRSSLAADDDGRVELPGGLMPEPAPVGPWPWLGALLAALGTGSAFMVARAGARRVRTVARDPAEIASAALDALGVRDVAGDADVQAFHVAVSAIVRTYIEERFALRAAEMTTEEFLASPSTGAAFDPSQRAMLADFLGACDLVKFARGASTAAERERLSDIAARFVSVTRLATRSAAEAR